MLRSLDSIDKGVASVAWERWRATPHPWAGAGVELAGRDLGGQGDLIGGGKHCPASAWRRNSRHQPSRRLSQQARLGMKACWMRGWSTSQVRVLALLWLERLSVITMMAPSGLAGSPAARSCWSPAELRDGAVIVTACPSPGRSAPYTQVFSG